VRWLGKNTVWQRPGPTALRSARRWHAVDVQKPLATSKLLAIAQSWHCLKLDLAGRGRILAELGDNVVAVKQELLLLARERFCSAASQEQDASKVQQSSSRAAAYAAGRTEYQWTLPASLEWLVDLGILTCYSVKVLLSTTAVPHHSAAAMQFCHKCGLAPMLPAPSRRSSPCRGFPCLTIINVLLLTAASILITPEQSRAAAMLPTHAHCMGWRPLMTGA